MDVIGGIIARLDPLSPIWADRLRWRRTRNGDVALRVVDTLVRRGSTVLDVGAHRGMFSVRMRDLVGSAGAVHAFEPNPEHLARLRSIGTDGRVTVHAVALSDRDGAAVLRVPIDGSGEQSGLATLEERESPDQHALDIQTIRLDDVRELSDRIDFIKCDVEGHEDAVIRGAERVLMASKPTILVEVEQRHRHTSPWDAFSLLASLGYTGWALFPAGIKPLESFDLQRDQLEFLAHAGSEPIMPQGYVHNFLFTARAVDLGSLLAPGCTGTVSRSHA